MYEQRSFVAVVLLVAAVWPHALCPANGAQYQLAVVNDVPAHYEVLAGVLYTLRPYRDVTKAFVAGDPAEADRLGLSTWLGSDAATTLHPLRALSPSSSDRATVRRSARTSAWTA